MRDEEKFIEDYDKQKDSLRSWGQYIKEYIFTELKKQKHDTESFIKIQVLARVKDDSSIIEKAFYRGKNYSNPLDDITDKVGIRFVVLLLDDIKIIQNIIEDCREWNISEDKNFEWERLENPSVFEYQSVHYIIRNTKAIIVNNITIDQLTPCEVQIRTLLQHAFSELSHDTVYKPSQTVEPMIKRLVARSMAMIETTDSIFKEVNDKMTIENNKKSNNLLPIIKDEYTNRIRMPEENNKIQELIIDVYEEMIAEINAEDLINFINEHIEMLKEQINSKYNTQLLFRQPVILLLYYLINQHPNKVSIDWPLTEDLIKPIYTKLGISFNS
ncbi:GTP pyrophosphokinase [Clostridium estertheticum]|uniref:RelA/SpoT domain-containing protein n=1 Tax=Clostridium estertheticum TaxID=238834 RepID=A0AA47I8B5_9CLOT|nr:RelA/SpoT domain-containing protein [Clostridium estertheticum]MBU3155200.1 RelA/SpoT domain-containing protein [Clostridium estertheticum]WAG61254.1 RelA/SpoT domain-containing protein [Clostridium estertheticum]